MGLSYEGADRQGVRFPLLDPLRALAAISVLLVHTSISARALDDPFYGRFLAHLDIGVPVFFLLSAFVLYRPFVQARVDGVPRSRFTDYGRRRFVRIAPAYWAVLTITAIVPGMAGAFTGNWWVYYGLLQNFPVYERTGTCAVDPFHCAIPVAWTLTIEVLFYLGLPLFVLAMGWLAERTRARWLWFELAVIAAFGAVSIVIQSSVPLSELHQWLFFSPLGRGWWFGLGLALAAISVEVARRPQEPAFVAWSRRHSGVLVLAGVALYTYAVTALLAPVPTLAFPLFIDLRDYVTEYLLFGVIAALFLVPMIFGADGGGLARRLLRHRSLTWLGLVSYGIYLWHYPTIILLTDAGITDFVPLTALTFAITTACAAASYYLLERPLMRWTRRSVAGLAAATT